MRLDPVRGNPPWRRNVPGLDGCIGFWCFIVGNILRIAWALHADAYALIALQVGLFVLNLRGVRKNDPELQRS